MHVTQLIQGSHLVGCFLSLGIVVAVVLGTHPTGYLPDHRLLLYLLSGLFGQVGGPFALKASWFYWIKLIASSIGGAFCIMASVDYFATQGRVLNMVKAAYSSLFTDPGRISSPSSLPLAPPPSPPPLPLTNTRDSIHPLHCHLSFSHLPLQGIYPFP